MKNNITAKVSEVIDANTSEVWNALTKPEIIKKYFFGTTAISDWKEGSSIIFRGMRDGKPYVDKGTILKTDPGKLFVYSYWSPTSGVEDKLENYVIISYELNKMPGKTALIIKQENIPDEKKKIHAIENWKKVLSNLKELFEKEHA